MGRDIQIKIMLYLYFPTQLGLKIYNIIVCICHENYIEIKLEKLGLIIKGILIVFALIFVQV